MSRVIDLVEPKASLCVVGTSLSLAVNGFVVNKKSEKSVGCGCDCDDCVMDLEHVVFCCFGYGCSAHKNVLTGFPKQLSDCCSKCLAYGKNELGRKLTFFSFSRMTKFSDDEESGLDDIDDLITLFRETVKFNDKVNGDYVLDYLVEHGCSSYVIRRLYLKSFEYTVKSCARLIRDHQCQLYSTDFMEYAFPDWTEDAGCCDKTAIWDYFVALNSQREFASPTAKVHIKLNEIVEKDAGWLIRKIVKNGYPIVIRMRPGYHACYNDLLRLLAFESQPCLDLVNQLIGVATPHAVHDYFALIFDEAKLNVEYPKWRVTFS